MIPPITAVLITREDVWPTAIRSVLGSNFPFAEVLIQCRCPDIFTRYTLAQQAHSDIIYVQDDDCVVNIDELWSHYNGSITNAITEERYNHYAGTGVTLIGWGAFFPKSMIDFTRWTERFGPVDPIEADRIFTYLHQPHNTHIMRIHELPRHSRMLSNQPGHDKRCNELIQQLRKIST